MPDSATILRAIQDYYEGSSNAIWEKIQLGTATSQEVSYAYSQIPQLQAQTTPSGRILGWDYADPIYLSRVDNSDVQAILDSIDSNIGDGSSAGPGISGKFPVDTYGSSGAYRAGGGALTGSGSVLATVADKVSLAAAGVSLGAKIGASIDRALYNFNPDWWDEHFPTINPATWSTMAQSEGGKFFLRTLFGTAGDEMSAYMTSEALAYTYMMLRELGAFNDGAKTADYSGDTSHFSNPTVTSVSLSGNTISWEDNNFIYIRDYPSDSLLYATKNGNSTNIVIFNKEKISYTQTVINKGTGESTRTSHANLGNANTTYNNTSFYFQSTTYTADVTGSVINSPRVTDYRQIGTILFDGTISTSSPIDGITPNSVGQTPDPSVVTGTTVDEVINQLKQNYPHLFDGSISTSNLQDDGTLEETEYVPVPWPSGQTQTSEQTTTGTATQESTKIDDKTVEDLFPPTDITNPPDTGEGSTDSPVLPTGNASSLWAVYNPTQAQLNAFGAWLWSSDFVEQLKKLFADPMQAIIGVHKVFATPHTGGSQTIKCGYLDSGVSASVVTSQYTTVDCGSASLREYFGNVFDYDPFTKVSIFLPFIGIVPLNTADVMRSTVSVKYKVDVITGACLAEVSISRDGGGGILYTYGGSAIVTYPISSGSYVGAVQAALSTAIGIGSAIATGGASLGASAGMVLGGLSHAKTQVQHSGQFSGSSGAMGGKKPYLIVSRPQTRTPSKIGAFAGIPANAYTHVGSCNGYARFKEVHLSIPGAYDNEVREIETLLKDGVII